MNKIRTIFAFVITLGLLSACSNGNKETSESASNAPEAFKEQFTQVVNEYYALKDALVETKAEEAQRAANNFRTAVEQADAEALNESQRADWAVEKQTLFEAAVALQETADVEKQREHFQTISNTLATSLPKYGIKEGTVYQQYCPMAFDDTGAIWLSKEKKVANPYFGSKMLRCGEVQKEMSF